MSSAQSCYSVSSHIRQRLEAANARFHANDNISAFIHEGEVAMLEDELTEKFGAVLSTLVIDTKNDHNTHGSARRVARMMIQEVFRGRYFPEPAVTEFPNVEKLSEMMVVGPMTVRSACSHHFCPVLGQIWLGIIPNADTNVLGLSKYARLVEWIMTRPQIQEEAIVQVANLIEEKIAPVGLALLMKATHFCMHWRGVKEADSKMTNVLMRGRFQSDLALRREFLLLAGAPGEEAGA